MYFFRRILFLVFFLAYFQLDAQQNWFVSPTGTDSSSNGRTVASPFASITYAAEFVQQGDTIQVLAGEYFNTGFGSGDIWNTESTVKINNLHGEENAYIYIKPYQDAKVILKGDGLCMFRLRNSSYIQIEGFEVYGEVENISMQTARDNQFIYKDADGNIKYRVPAGSTADEVAAMTLPVLYNISRPNYTDTKGIYVSKSHHINLINNLVHHTPGGGLRVASGDYINIIGNEVHNCSRKSYSGTHALVVSESLSIDENEGYKITIAQNKVHHNYNEIYSWAPSKTFITPHIDEGKGISLQKNSTENGWTHGRFLVVNNIAYKNGFAGIHNNSGERMDFYNNTCYYNSLSESGNNIGMSTQGGNDIRFKNNIVVTDPVLSGYAISVANTLNVKVKSNISFGNTDPDVVGIQVDAINADPMFIDVDDFDFRLESSSPALDAAIISAAPSVDYFNNARDAFPDIGAVEYMVFQGIDNPNDQFDYKVYPNPFDSFIIIQSSQLNTSDITIFNLFGQDISALVQISKDENIKIKTQALKPGPYSLGIKGNYRIVIKKEQ